MPVSKGIIQLRGEHLFFFVKKKLQEMKRDNDFARGLEYNSKGPKQTQLSGPAPSAERPLWCTLVHESFVDCEVRRVGDASDSALN